MTKKVFLFIFLVLYRWKDGSFASRQRRQILYPPPIVYPYGGTFKLVVGYAVPVELAGRTLVYGQNFQFQYVLPQNATFFTEFFKNSSRRRRESVNWDERITVYRLLEGQLERKGIDGRECMKKSICEAAMAPLKDEGLVGELLHLLLTPQRGNNSSLNSEYLEALEFGQKNYDCSLIYKSCLSGQGILDQISKVIS
ncbi:hypothetical protein ACFW04_008049 [Cataglyphis niger]